MSRVLLVTNDFPPRRGGIQSYLAELVSRLAATGEHTLTVYAPRWEGAEVFDVQTAGYQVVRHPGTLMLPVPTVDARPLPGADRRVVLPPPDPGSRRAIRVP